MDIETDVLVVGGGICGCAVAYFLARQGVDVVLIDRDDLFTQASGRNAGSLHIQLVAFVYELGDAAERRSREATLPLFKEAVETWKGLSRELDCDIELSIGGGLMVAETEAQLRFLDGKTCIERAHGIDTHVITGAEVHALAPYLSEAVIGAEYCPGEGKLNPFRATSALARAAERAGARILRHTALAGLDRDRRGFDAKTDHSPIRCRRVVNAAGPWASEVGAMVGLKLPVRKVCVQANVTEPTAHFVDHLVYHCRRILTLKQVSNGNLVIGGGWPATVEPGTGHLKVARKSIEGNLWVAAHVVPRVRHLRLLRSWACMNLRTDGRPILGEVPGIPGFFNAIPADAGYTLGPVSARLVAEVMTGKSPTFDIAPFSVDRFSDSLGAPGAVSGMGH